MKLFEVTNTTCMRKSANRNAQISVIPSAHCPDLCFAMCRFSHAGCVCHLEQLHAQSPFLFPIVFSINLIPFFDICSVLSNFFNTVLSPGLFGCCFTWATAVATVAVCGFGSWFLVFHCGKPRKISPLPPTPSQTEVCSTMGESIIPSFLHNPTPSAKKHVVQFCRSSLSAAMQTVQVSVEPHLSTALKRSLSRAEVIKTN